MTKKPTDWMQYSGVGIQMAVTMMIGWWLGSKFEVHIGFSEPWGQLCGIFLGLLGAMYNLIKSVNR